MHSMESSGNKELLTFFPLKSVNCLYSYLDKHGVASGAFANFFTDKEKFELAVGEKPLSVEKD